MLSLIYCIIILNTFFTYLFATNLLKKDILDPIPYIIIINWLYFPLRIFFLLFFSYLDATRSIHFLEAYTQENILYVSIVSFLSLIIILFSTHVISFDKIKIPSLFTNTKFNIYFVHIINFLVLLILITKYLYGFTHYFGNNLINLTNSLNKILSYFGSLGPITYTFSIYLLLSKKIDTKLNNILILIFIAIYISYYLIFGGLDGIISLIFPFIIFKLKDVKFNFAKILPYILILSLTLYFGLILKKFTRIFKGIHDNTDISLSIFDFLISLSNRFHGADSFIILLHRLEIKQTFYLYGEMFYLFFAGLIPRIMWTDKPEISLGNTFNDLVWKPEIAEQIGSGHQSTAMMLQTEFYWNFSLIGVIIGFFIFSLVIQTFKKLFYGNYKNNLFALTFLTYSFPAIIRHEYSFASFLHGLIFIILYFNIYYIFISRK